MKNNFCLMLICFLSFSVQSQGIFGKWKTVDDETGANKSIVEIYKRNGKVFGKVIEILKPFDEKTLCQNCEGDYKDKPILGFEIIKDLEKDGEYYKHGTIFDAENGKEYRCRIKLDKETGKLQVRGYIAFLYLTQYWIRYN
ncbi:DUF2147 domain-containing protein [Algibacter sp. R77976]|uniref:DUF2147 domain-containing protein n=1 Tax=Algibacter sp. R77976 TaxID=3093873 RepID=UPI0037C9EDAA